MSWHNWRAFDFAENATGTFFAKSNSFWRCARGCALSNIGVAAALSFCVGIGPISAQFRERGAQVSLTAALRYQLIGERPFKSLAVSPDGQLAAAGSYDGRVFLWDLQSGKQRKSIALGKDVSALAFSRDGKRLAASVSTRREVVVWDLVAGKELFAVPGLSVALAYHPKGRILVHSVGGLYQTICYRDATTGEVRREIKLSDVRNLAFNKDGSLVAVCHGNGIVTILNGETGAVLKKLGAHQDYVGAVCFSANLKYLASASRDRTVKIWDTNTWESIRTISLPDWAVSVTYSHDGKWLAVGTIGKSSQISVRDANSGKEILRIKDADGARRLAFCRQGTLLVNTGGHRTVKVWDIITKKHPAKAKER